MKGYVTSFVALFEPPRGDTPAVDRIEIPLYPARLRPRAPSASVDGDPEQLPRRAPRAPSRRRARRPGLRVRRGRRRHASAARRPAAAHHAVPAPLVSRVPRRAARSRGTAGSGSPTRRDRARACSASDSSTTPRRPDVATPSSVDHRPAVVPLRLAHDPTIQSMLVMIDAIHERFAVRRRRGSVGAARPTQTRRRSRSTCFPSTTWDPARTSTSR